MLRTRDSSYYHSIYYRAFARLTRNVRKKDFTSAQSYAERDEVSRMLAAECYGLAQKFANEGKPNLSLQYTKLAAKLLGMSLRPKKLLDLEDIKRTLARLNGQKASR